MAMHLPGSVLMVAGRNGQVHLARRYTLIGDDDQALTEGIFAMQQDLESLQKILGQRMPHVDWIEALTFSLNLARPEVDIPLLPWPVHALSMGGERAWSALPLGVRRASTTEALGPKEESWLRPLENLERIVWAALATVVLVAGAFIYLYGQENHNFILNISVLKQQISQAEQDIQARQAALVVENLGQAVAVARDFNQAASLPPFAEMWNYLASLRPKPVRVDGVELSYSPEGLGVRLEGEVELEMATAQQVFDTFLNTLQKSKFKLESQKIDLGLEGNFYTVNLTWTLAQEGE